MAGNVGKCPFCNAEKVCKTYGESVAEMMKRVEAQDAGAMNQLAQNYYWRIRFAARSCKGNGIMETGRGTWI